MKKNKYFVQASGKEDKSTWKIYFKVDEFGKIRERYFIKLYSHEEGQEYYNKNQEKMARYQKKHRKSINKRSRENYRKNKTKYFTLLSGKEEDMYWSIGCIVDSFGKIQKSPSIYTVSSSSQHKNYLKHREKRLEEAKIYRECHVEERKDYAQRYNCTHKEALKKTHRLWKEKNPDRVQTLNKEAKARRRDFGFNPLNKPIEGIECDAHHINKDDIVYIPRVIHKSVFHSLKNNKNMKVINSIAYSFL